MEGVDFRFQEKMRGVVEYMQYREMPADIKRKVSLPPLPWWPWSAAGVMASR